MRAGRGAIRFEVSPASRLWVAICLGSGGAFFAVAMLWSLSAAVMSLEHAVLEAFYLSSP